MEKINMTENAGSQQADSGEQQAAVDDLKFMRTVVERAHSFDQVDDTGRPRPGVVVDHPLRSRESQNTRDNTLSSRLTPWGHS